MLTRRHLLQKSAISGITLLAFENCLASQLIPAAPEGLGHSFEFLTPYDRGILSKLTPVILAEALPKSTEESGQAIKEVIVGWDNAVSGLPTLTQKEIRKLFSVLDSNFIFSLTPRLLTGVPEAWNDPSEIEDFLYSWYISDPESLITGNELRIGYMGLVELTMAVWYGNPRSWDFCGYAGPPDLL
ncbi:MAG: hypothetical protein MAG581_01342 [Deltaproteobacteria bacterium]|nr:hypothetical protein [Deltaproteobacteria bacterium]